jgi:hypothetical protein
MTESSRSLNTPSNCTSHCTTTRSMWKRNGHKECVREPRAIGCVPSIHLAHAAPLGTERGRTSRGAYVSRLPLLPTLDARLVCAVGSIHPLLNRWSRLRYYESNVRPQRIHMVQVLEVVRSNPFDLSNSVSTILFAHTWSSLSLSRTTIILHTAGSDAF